MISSSLYPAFALATLQTCDTSILSPHNGHWPSSHIYIKDTNGSMPYAPLTDHTAIFHDDDVWNTSVQPGTVNVTLTIQNQDTGQQVFNQTQSLQMQACSGPESVKWRFVPIQVANYIATVSDNRGNVSMIFNSMLDATKSQTVSSPLEQFKAGIALNQIQCKGDLVPMLKIEDNSPACVIPQHVTALYLRQWGNVLHGNIVFLIKPNSNGQIFVKYTNLSHDIDAELNTRLYSGSSGQEIHTTNLQVSVNPTTVQYDKTLVATYNFVAQNTTGIYWLQVESCQFIPIAVAADSSQVSYSDLQSVMSGWRCPVSFSHYNVVNVSNMTVEYRGD